MAGAGWIALRCLALIGMYLTMYPALPLIGMALAGAAFYTAPLFIAGLSALMLGQKITRLQWLAVFVGFAGLLLIVQPFGLSFTPVILMPVIAAFCYACAAIMTRTRSLHACCPCGDGLLAERGIPWVWRCRGVAAAGRRSDSRSQLSVPSCALAAHGIVRLEHPVGAGCPDDVT